MRRRDQQDTAAGSGISSGALSPKAASGLVVTSRLSQAWIELRQKIRVDVSVPSIVAAARFADVIPARVLRDQGAREQPLGRHEADALEVPRAAGFGPMPSNSTQAPERAIFS